MGEFDYSNLAESRAKARRYRWTATAKARVTHEKFGSVIVPHRSNYTAIENAAEFWRCQKREDYTTALASVYAMDIQADNVADTIANIKDLCLDYFKPTAAEAALICDHVIQCDSLKIMRMLAREDLSHEIYCFPKSKDRLIACRNGF